MRKFYHLFILVFISFSACDDFNDPESPYIEQYVVFGNISGNMSMIDDTIFVSRSASLDEKVEANQLWVSDAEITIFEEKSENKLLNKTSAKIVLSYSTVEILKKYDLWDSVSFRPNFIDKIHLSYSNSLGSTTISSYDENLDFLGAHIQTDFLKKKLIESIYSNKNIQLNSGTHIFEINGKNKKQIFFT